MNPGGGPMSLGCSPMWGGSMSPGGGGGNGGGCAIQTDAVTSASAMNSGSSRSILLFCILQCLLFILSYGIMAVFLNIGCQW